MGGDTLAVKVEDVFMTRHIVRVTGMDCDVSIEALTQMSDCQRILGACAARCKIQVK